MIDGVSIRKGSAPIDGAKVIPLRRIPFIQFGQIYFSTVSPGVVKGWHQPDYLLILLECEG